MDKEIKIFHNAQTKKDKQICEALFKIIDRELPMAENKMWHRHPVWFLNDNPIVGYSKLKGCIRLMFWSGASFDEPHLQPGTGKFKDASMRYTNKKSNS